MNTHPERRRHKRIGLEHLNIQAKTIISASGNIIDIGLTGACLSTTQRLMMNDNYEIEFHLDGRHVSHSGTVRWEKLVGSTMGSTNNAIPIYMTGMEFTSVLTDNGKDILEVLYTFSENRGQRLGGKRLKLKSPAKAVVHVLKEFQIKQISTGGMLIETDLDFLEGETYFWTLSFPGQKNHVRCKGRIVSRLKIYGKRQYNFGVVFSDIQKEDRKNLALFIMEAMFSGTKPSLLN